MYCKAGSVGTDSTYETVSEGSSHTYSESSNWSYSGPSDYDNYDNYDRRSYKNHYNHYHGGSGSGGELPPFEVCVVLAGGGLCFVAFVIHME